MDKVIDIQKEIGVLIKRNEDTYAINPSRIISDFRGEKQTTDDYRGRQLLELLQNADDAKTDKINVFLDVENQILSVANNGDNFDLKGIQSLLIANLSSKNKKEFIGNKGLGFRSILNWTTQINIKTKDFVLTFSPAIVKEKFEEFFPDITERDNLIKQNQKYLAKGEVPFAVLALPEFKAGIENQEWETIIELKYHKTDEDEIIEQLKAITPRILLFLNSTNQIEISGAGDLDTRIQRNFLNSDKSAIQINDRQWHIYNSGEIPYPKEDDKFYQFKIAWQDDLSDEDSTFFTYFPTEVSTQLPFLIHATFELNQSRNDLLKGNKNQFLLEKIAKAIGEIALTKIRRTDQSDWKAFQFLEPLYYNNNPKLDSFFKKLLELQKELEIYPCVDGTYCKLEDAIFYGDEFSEWVISNNIEEHFPGLLQPIDNLDIDLNAGKVYSNEGWLEIINKINDKITSLHERAQLIKLLIGSSFDIIHDSKIKLPLLLDTKSYVIPESAQAFLLSKEDIEQYKIPKYVEISFMSGELYEELLLVLEDEIRIKWNGTEHKSRPLRRIISNVVNIGSNDITDVIRNIVNASDRKINDSEGEVKNDIAIGLVEALFSIYQVNPDRRNSINLNISLLNKNLDLCLARDLYLGDDYELGESTSIIFKDIFSDDKYLVGNEFWKLEKGGYEYLENFFEWLGVNRITKIASKSEYIDRNEQDDYTNFVFANTAWPENKSHKEYSVDEITDFVEISSNVNFSIEVLIAWILSDSFLLSQLDYNNQDKFNYTYYNNVTPLNYKPSYIFYQIKELYLKKIAIKFIVGLDFAKELGFNSIDFQHPVFIELEINEDDILGVLTRLDIGQSFDDLEPEEVYKIIQELPNVDLEGKYARKLYNLAFIFFKLKKDFDYNNQPKDYKLLAKNRNKKEYITFDKVYYSDNSTLPSKIAEDFWVFDFPKRSGESQISKFFGVKTFKDVDLQIFKESITESVVNVEFQKWFEKIKPYILTHRLSSIKDSIQKNEADELKKVDIKIVSSLNYAIENGESKNLLSGEFLPSPTSQGFYLCVEDSATIEVVKDTPKICEAFAEILCVLFMVNEHKDNYRTIFKDKNNLKDTIFTIEVNSLTEHYNQALELLGISKDESRFWSRVYEFVDKEFPSTITESDELAELVLNDFGFKISKQFKNIDYTDFNDQQSIDFLKELTSELEIPVSHLFDEDFNDIINYHKGQFENTLFDFKEDFNTSLWKHLNQNKELQKQLITFQEKYENLIHTKMIENVLLDNRFELELNYLDVLKEAANKEFGIEIDKDTEVYIIKILPEYKVLLKDNKINEVDIEEAEIRSLLYFKGNNEEILGYLASIKDNNDNEDDFEFEEEETGEIIFSSSIKINPTISNGKNRKKGSWNHSDKDVKRNKISGKKAEQIVFNSLKKSEEIEKVEWVSSFSNTSDKSDNKHYDIRYKSIDNPNWKYLEVKSFNGTYFHLSRSEKNEAIKRGKDFEIALVIDGQVHILKDYFNEDVDFDNNDLFFASPSDYIISLQLKKEQ